MKRYISKIFLISFLLFFFMHPNSASADAAVLSIGTTSPKVRILQQILNTDPDTLVSISGAGSKGIETEYFGPRTLQALIKFQRKYYAQIGLQSQASASGKVDDLTKKYLNSLLSSAASSVQAKSPSTIAYNPQSSLNSTSSRSYLDSLIAEMGNRSSSIQNMLSIEDLKSAYAFASTSKSYIDVSDPAVAAGMTDFFYKTIDNLEKNYGIKIPIISGSTKVVISNLSKDAGAPGDKINIYGKGFAPSGNVVYFNNQKIEGVASNSLGTIVSTTIPKDVFGPVQVSVESNGEKSWPAGIIVAKAGAIAPKIYATKSSMNIGDTLTLSGTGLAKINTVYSTVGQVDNVPLVGTSTLQIKLTDFSGLAVWKSTTSTKPITTSVVFWISNENGMSDAVGPISIKI